jgi:hypothetical protein
MYIVLLCIAIFENTTPVLQQDLLHINYNVPDSLMAGTTVNASVEYITKYTVHKFSLVVSRLIFIQYD